MAKFTVRANKPTPFSRLLANREYSGGKAFLVFLGLLLLQFGWAFLGLLIMAFFVLQLFTEPTFWHAFWAVAAVLVFYDAVVGKHQ